MKNIFLLIQALTPCISSGYFPIVHQTTSLVFVACLGFFVLNFCHREAVVIFFGVYAFNCWVFGRVVFSFCMCVLIVFRCHCCQ